MSSKSFRESISEETAAENKNIKEGSPVSSQFVKVYQEAFKKVNEKHQDPITSPSFKVANYNELQNERFTFSVVKEFNNYEIVVVLVKMGHFQMQLKILNSDKNSPFSRIEPMFEGSYGQIFTFEFQGRQVAVKSYDIFGREMEEIPNIIARVIKQYCIFKICDQLDSGPSIPNCFGFDIIIFNNRIEFAMEKCQQLSHIDENDIENLFLSLGKMHQYHVLHLDISPENILWSSSKNKMVFIDFGFSDIIIEDLGLKTYTFFHGTPSFVSKEMMKLLFSEPKYGYVDLYFNDLVCFQQVKEYFQTEGRQVDENGNIPRRFKKSHIESFEQFFTFQPKNTQSGLDKNVPQIRKQFFPENWFLFVLFHHQLVFNEENAKNVLKYDSQKLMKVYKRGVFELLRMVPPSQAIKEIVYQELKQFSNLEQYKQLYNFFKHRLQTILRKQNRWENFSSINIFRDRFIVKTELREQIYQQKKHQVLKIMKDVEGIKKKEDREGYFSVLYSLLRFDQRNISLQQKNDISQTFLLYLNLDKDEEQEDKLSILRRVFKYLFSYCLSEPYTEWKGENRLSLMIQSVLLDVDIRQQQQKIDCMISKGSISFIDHFQLFYEIFMINKTYQFKYAFTTCNVEQPKAILRKFKELLQSSKELIIKRHFNSHHEADKKIARIIKMIFDSNTKTIEKRTKIVNKITKIADQQHKMTLMKLFFMVEISKKDHSNNNMSTRVLKELYQKMSDIFEKSSYPIIQNFTDKLFWKYEVILDISYSKIIKAPFEEIKYIINCPQIYKTLTIQENQFIYISQWNIESAKALRSFFQSTFNNFFTQKRLELFSKWVFIRVLDHSINSDIVSEQCSDLLQKWLERYLRLTEKDLHCEVESVQKGEKEAEEIFFSAEQCSFQNSVYFHLLKLINLQHLKQSLQKRIVQKYWHFLSLQSSQNILFEMMKLMIPFFSYYYMVNGQSISKPMLFYLNILEKMLILNSDSYHFMKIFEYLLQLQSYIGHLVDKKRQKMSGNGQARIDVHSLLGDTQSLIAVKRINKLLVWGCNQFLLKGKIHYLFDFGYIYKTSICVLLKSLDHDIGHEEMVFKLLQEIVYFVNKHPSKHHIQNYVSNVTLFSTSSEKYFQMKSLQPYLGPVTLQNTNSLLCYALCLPRERKEKRIKKFIQSFLEHIKYIDSELKLVVISNYFDTVLIHRLLGSYIKRKQLFMFQKYRQFKAKTYDITSEVEYILQLTGLSRKQSQVQKIVLRDKIAKIGQCNKFQ